MAWRRKTAQLPVFDYSYAGSASELRCTLEAAAEERGQRPELDERTGEPGWVAYERQLMHDTVNVLRARQGKVPVDGQAIVHAEQRAIGHIDYVLKFALGCADVVHAD